MNPRLRGPRGCPLVGHVATLRREPLSSLTKWSRTYGDIVPFRIREDLHHLVSDPTAIHEVLTAHRVFDKAGSRRALGFLLGDGLLLADGDRWQEARTVLQPLFGNVRVRQYAQTVRELAGAFMAGWHTGRVVHIDRELAKIGIAAMAEILVGAPLAPLALRLDRPVRAGLNVGAERSFALALWPSWIPSRLNRAALEQRRAVDEIIVALATAGGTAATGHPRGILDLLLDAHPSPRPTFIRDQLLTLYVTGSKTATTTVAWACYLVSKSADVQAKLRAEMDTVLGERDPSPDDLGRLRYAGMVLEETLRLFPPAWAITRRVTEDRELLMSRLVAGSFVTVSPWVTQRDARLYSEPERFMPERWAIGTAQPPKGAYFPFGLGPRTCLGASFAKLQMLMLLTMVLRRFVLHPVEGATIEPRPEIIRLVPSSGLPMFVEKASSRIDLRAG